MKVRWLAAAGIAGCLVLNACGGDPGVLTASARQQVETATPSTPPATEPTTPTTEAAPPPPTEAPATTTPAPPPPTAAPPPLTDLLNVGDAKPARDYDDLVRAALADLEAWWTVQYPALYGEPYPPLTGGVFSFYPERSDPVPGCGGNAVTTYEEISKYTAFYCPQGDFLVYDDGENGLLAQLSREYGPSLVGVVLAHEWGHTIQARASILERDLPTIVTEQQADCFAGAWVARAASGQAPGLPFTDAEVRTGLIAMITVRDPAGFDQFEPGGHGSAFDRVGAFQTGFTEGVERCAGLIDDPLPLVSNQWNSNDDAVAEGNLAFGYGENELVGNLTEDLNTFWPAELATAGAEGTALTLVPVRTQQEYRCAEPAGDIALGAVWCPATDEVYFDEPAGLELYDRLGDFTIGYTLGMAWSEAAQAALGSPLGGEARALASDCLTGAWVSGIVPGADRSGRAVWMSPGDLDEAIQTALIAGDPAADDDVVGSAFEKIAAFREGVLGGLPACQARLGE